MTACGWRSPRTTSTARASSTAIGELALIRALRTALGGRDLIGDDAAVVPVSGDRCVVSTDAMVEDVHFAWAWAEPYDVGWRACAGALSDLAAMAAQSGEVYVALTVPRGFEAVAEVMDGVRECAVAAGATVAGGDLVGGPVLQLAVTVVGWLAPGDRPLRRSGASPGDLVAVTGRLGGAAAALRAPATADLGPLVRPRPRIEAGRALARAGASAAMDLSDGLASDACRIAEESGVRLELTLAALPTAPGATAELAATGGEDFELLVCIPPDALDACRTAVGDLTVVGTVVAGAPAAVFTDASGPLAGYEHLR